MENHLHIYFLENTEVMDLVAMQRLEQEYLASDEQEIYRQIVMPQGRQEFLLGRALVRSILGAYLHCSPQQLILASTEYGKPYVHYAGEVKRPEIFFNLAHSATYFALAITTYGEIGIDIEEIGRYQRKVAHRFFQPAEYAWLENLAPEQQAAAFYHCWTVKEACLKARGTGLHTPAREIYVSPEPSGRSQELCWYTIDVSEQIMVACALRVAQEQTCFIFPTPCIHWLDSIFWKDAQDRASQMQGGGLIRDEGHP